jgi:hypothetical protein
MMNAITSDIAPRLNPCPFCGGRGELGLMPGTTGWWRVRCKDYHCGGTTWALQGREVAVSAWNRRVTTDGPQ